MREFILAKARKLLESKGFAVSSFLYTNTCFDLAARRESLVILLKVFDNVDALREEHAAELKKMVGLFNAVAIVLGAKTKTFALKTGVIYERYGLPTLSIDSFKGLLDERLPSVRSFKGREIVELDSERLKSRRKELGITMQDLASKIDTTIESIHRYEKGHSASLSTAEKLEKALDTRLVKKIDLFQGQPPGQENVFDEVIDDSALEKVHDLGLKLAIFRHAPFKASSQAPEGLMISKGTSKTEVKRKAIGLQKTSVAFKTHGMLITSKTKLRAIEHIPIVEEEELTTLSKFKDLMQLLREREKAGNGQ